MFSWGEILTEIRDRLNEPTAGFFTDSGLMAAFNQVALKFAREVRVLRKEINLTFSGDGYSVALPSDYLGTISVGVTSSDSESMVFLPLLGLHGRARDSQMGNGYYFADAKTIKTSAQQTDGTARLRLQYYTIPMTFADETDLDAETNIPDEYVDTLIIGVVARSYLKQTKYEDYQFMDREYRKMVKDDIKAEGKKRGSAKQLNIVE